MACKESSNNLAIHVWPLGIASRNIVDRLQTITLALKRRCVWEQSTESRWSNCSDRCEFCGMSCSVRKALEKLLNPCRAQSSPKKWTVVRLLNSLKQLPVQYCCLVSLEKVQNEILICVVQGNWRQFCKTHRGQERKQGDLKIVSSISPQRSVVFHTVCVKWVLSTHC